MFKDIFCNLQKTSRSSVGSCSGSRSPFGEHQAPPPSSPHQAAVPLEDMYSIPVKKSLSDMPSTVTPPPGRQDTPLSDSPFEGMHNTHYACTLTFEWCCNLTQTCQKSQAPWPHPLLMSSTDGSRTSRNVSRTYSKLHNHISRQTLALAHRR